MSDATTARPALGVTDILGNAISLLISNFVPLMIVASIPALLEVLFALATMGAGLTADTHDMGAALKVIGFFQSATGIVVIVISCVLAIVLWSISVVAVASFAFSIRAGRKTSVHAALRVGVDRVLPAIGCSLVTLTAGLFGLMFFIVPGLYLFALWFLAIPVIGIEKLGFSALGRSARLTEGYRWPLVGLIVLSVLISIGLSIPLGFIQLGAAFAGTAGVVVSLLANAVVSAFTYALVGVLSVLAYDRLCEIKEGTGSSSVPEIFE